MKWYVLYVKSGLEDDIKQSLKALGLPAMVPKEERLIRKGGTWYKEENILFTGYVFFALPEFDADLYHKIKKHIDGIIKILYSPISPTPLYDYEADNLMMMCEDDVMRISEVVKCGDNITVTAGALKGYEGKIISVDKHRKKIKAGLSIMGAERIVNLSANIITKSD